MASPIGRLSAVGSVGLSLGAALAFFAAARWVGEAPWTAIVGGTVWVFLLALIVSLPLVTGWMKRRSAGRGPDARRHRGNRSAMELTAAVWLCTLPFIFLLLGPWLGFKVVLVVALAWAVVTAVVCWMACDHAWRVVAQPRRCAMKTRSLGWLAAVAMGVLAWTGVALAATGKVYVADEEGDTVTVLDATSFAKLTTIPVGREPHNVQVSPDGRWAWVTINYEVEAKGNGEAKHPAAGMPKAAHEAMTAAGQVWVIDTATDRVVEKIRVGKHPAHVVLSPDGRFAYVTNGGDDTVSVVDTTARTTVATIPVDAYPHGIRVSPDGREAYVANLKGGNVSVIDTEARKEVAKIAVGKGPAQVGFTPDGRTAFASLSQENAVAVIDPATRKLVKKVPVGPGPIQVYATPDSRLLFVANQGSKKAPGRTVSLVDLARLEVTKTVETGPGAHGVVVTSDGRYAFVTNIYANNVSVIEIASPKVVATVAVGKGPNGISVTP